MNNINENKKILNISFNQDNSCFAISTQTGFIIYETFPFKKRYEKNLGGSIKITEMYYRSNILALVSGGDFPKFDQKKLIIWDDSLNKVISDINFYDGIKKVKMKKDKIYIINDINLFVFNLKTMENIEIISILENSKGLFSINSDEKNDVIAYLGELNEKEINNNIYINIKNYNDSSDVKINLKDEMISFISLNNHGNLLAIANDKGNEIKIFSCIKGELLAEFFRGKEKAEINCICFDNLNNFIAVSSDRGTIHIWSLKKTLHKLTELKKDYLNSKDNSDENKINNIDELPENKKLIFSKNEKSFAKIRLKSPKSIISFMENNIIVVVTTEGIYYQAQLDTKNGGTCKIIEQKDINSK